MNDEPAAPSSDPIDRQIQGRGREYGRQLAKARKALEDARDIQTEIVSRLTLEQARALVEGAGVCSNCGYVAAGTREDRIVKTRCRLCYPYWRAHGEERPQGLIEASL